MYYIYGVSRPSLLIESTDSMTIVTRNKASFITEIADKKQFMDIHACN